MRFLRHPSPFFAFRTLSAAHPNRGRLLTVLVGSGVLLFTGVFGGRAAEEPVKPLSEEQVRFFETKIRPLLADRCFSCHSDKQQMGGLRLDSPEHLVRGNANGPAILAGNPDKSNLIRAIRYESKIKMPPTGKLLPADIALLTTWVQQGAVWPTATKAPRQVADASHWSFQPVKKVAPPKVKNTWWVKNPVDAFILAKLEAKGLKPAPVADRRTLLRRVTFDLTGLPPTPDEMTVFLNDKSPDAWEKVVDRLLASPAYGERWGRHWLDVARYADSNGLDENLAFGNAWRYRDYVVAAFNQDKPYNEFLTEQLAGDLLPTDDEALRNARLTATGFLSLGPKVLAEQDKPKMVMDIVDEQIEVTSKAFLGLTVACARCHDHKFDPISTKDYYALAGIFKSTRTMRDLGFVSRVHERPLPTKALQEQRAVMEKQVQESRDVLRHQTEQANAALLTQIRTQGEKYLRAGWEILQQPGVRSLAELPVKSGDPPRLIVEAEKFDRGNVQRDFETYGQGIGVIHNIGTPDFAEWDVAVPAAGTYQVELRYAAAESRPVRLLLNGQVIGEQIAGQVTGSWQPDGQRWEAVGIFAFRAGKNTLRIERTEAIPHFDKLLIVAQKPTSRDPNAPAPRTADQIAAQEGLLLPVLKQVAEGLKKAPDLATALSRPNDFLALPEKPETLYSEAVKTALKQGMEAVKAAEAKLPPIPETLAVEEGKIEDVRVHLRGNTLTLGEVAPRRFLAVLGGEKQPPIGPQQSGRLELARWLTRPDHPLTGRVAVNRVWQGHFGVGLVRTPDNLGLLGERPTHPELLDWLAANFMDSGVQEDDSTKNTKEHEEDHQTHAKPNPPPSLVRNERQGKGAGGLGKLNWSLKRLHRLILLSNTYKMSSTNDAKAAQSDPDNRLFWRMNRRRLEVEPFRDAILAVSGQLDRTLGGSLLRSGNNDYVTNDQSANGAQYGAPRRSLYLPVIRNAVFDMFQAFDFGDPSMPNARRATTTVAPQALYVMNSPFVLEQARHFAESLPTSEQTTDTDRLTNAYLRAFSRPPTPYEVKQSLAYLTQYESHLQSMEPDAAKRRLKAWQSLCQILFASNEFISLN